MASGRSNDFFDHLDEEQEIFAGFIVEEVADIRQQRQRQIEQQMLRGVDEEIDRILDAEPQD